MKVGSFSIGALASLLVVLTALPLATSTQWWVRIWDFPRLQIAALLVISLLAIGLRLGWRQPLSWLLMPALLLSLSYQIRWIWPYTVFSGAGASSVASCQSDNSVRLLIANVKLSNRSALPIIEAVRRYNADVVLLVETDEWWINELSSLRNSYRFAISGPRSNGYGFYLLSSLELIEPKVRFLIDDYVPSLRTGLLLPSGVVLDFHGVHPTPPPMQDTARRDAELLLTANEVRESTAPSIVAGDLNDVAWSRSNSLFRKMGGLLDPRIGRGPYPTYNADWPLLRWPLDHILFEPQLKLLELKVLDDVGSDHFPLLAALCYRPKPHDAIAVPAPSSADKKAAREAIFEGRQVARERR